MKTKELGILLIIHIHTYSTYSLYTYSYIFIHTLHIYSCVYPVDKNLFVFLFRLCYSNTKLFIYLRFIEIYVCVIFYYVIFVLYVCIRVG